MFWFFMNGPDSLATVVLSEIQSFSRIDQMNSPSVYPFRTLVRVVTGQPSSCEARQLSADVCVKFYQLPTYLFPHKIDHFHFHFRFSHRFSSFFSFRANHIRKITVKTNFWEKIELVISFRNFCLSSCIFISFLT